MKFGGAGLAIKDASVPMYFDKYVFIEVRTCALSLKPITRFNEL